jgi:phosphonate transport system substrate-binding protein
MTHQRSATADSKGPDGRDRDRHRSLRRVLFTLCGLLAGLWAAGGPSLATWREDTKVLRVGYLATGNPAADASRMEPFRAYLEGRIALPVELVPSPAYAGLIDGAADGRIQYAILSATAFAALEAACTCVEPLAVPSAYDGSLGFHSILLARADGPVASLADAKGARLALAGEDSVAGRLVPTEVLAAEGIDVATYFAGVVSKPGPEAAISGLLSGDVDVAVGWSSLKGDPATGYSFGVLTRMVIDGRLAMDQVRVVWQSPLIPFGPHVVRTDIAPELKLLLADALFDMASIAPEVLEAVDRTGFGGGGR